MLSRPQGLRGLIDQEIRAHTPSSGDARENFRNFIQYARASSRILNPGQFRTHGGPDRLKCRMRGLLRMSLYRAHWVRPIESWFCDHSSCHEQINSLLQHLFAKYPVPRFLNQVWFESGFSGVGRTRRSTLGIAIYLALGRGVSPRKCGLPAELTKPMAREFMHAPDDLNVWQAIRWSQVRAAGGSQWLARMILRTRLNGRQEDEAFWQEVIQFFCRSEAVDSPKLTEDDVVSIVAFVWQQRFEPASRVLNYRFIGNDRPLQPDLSLRKRTLRWVRRHQVNWQNEVELPERSTREKNRRLGVWPSIGLPGFRDELSGETWVIKELLSAHELLVEGGIMKHCVGGYSQYCLKNQASIWSMRVLRNEVWKRMLTIELVPGQRMILQAKGKSNSLPSGAAARVLRRWANQENLRIRQDD